MVLLFLIASLQGDVPFPLFHRFYEETSQGSNDLSQGKLEGEEQACCSVNQLHRQQVKRVVELLHSQHYYHSETNASSNAEKDLQIFERDDWQHDVDVYNFRLFKMDPFPTDMRVIWLSVHGFGFAFVCYHYENRLMAEMILKLLTKHLNDFCHVITQPNEILTKPEKIQILLNKFLPYGQVLFMNHRVIRQFERETEAALKGAVN